MAIPLVIANLALEACGERLVHRRVDRVAHELVVEDPRRLAVRAAAACELDEDLPADATEELAAGDDIVLLPVLLVDALAAICGVGDAGGGATLEELYLVAVDVLRDVPAVGLHLRSFRRGRASRPLLANRIIRHRRGEKGSKTAIHIYDTNK